MKDVNVYKVVHHGSRNATPKTKLWELFENRKPIVGDMNKLICINSTVSGHHHGVQKASLEDTMKKESTYLSTEELLGELYMENEFTF